MSKVSNKKNRQSKLIKDLDMIFKVNKIDREIICKKHNNKLLHYNAGEKVHTKQMEFHKCNKKNRWVFGGNRSGKTECGAVEVVWLARGIHPYKENRKNTVGWVVSLTTQVQRDVAQNKVLYYINREWIYDIVMSSGKKRQRRIWSDRHHYFKECVWRTF